MALVAEPWLASQTSRLLGALGFVRFSGLRVVKGRTRVGFFGVCASYLGVWV